MIELKDKQVLVLGLGVHGGAIALIRWLVKHGAKVTVSDIKPKIQLAYGLKKLANLQIKYYFGGHPVNLLKGKDLVIQNPAVPNELSLLKAARRRRIPIENEASLFLKFCPASLIIGVTGSKGKSTTTSLLYSMVKLWRKNTVFAGNIQDVVMFDVLDKITPSTPVILELSSWQLEGVGEHGLTVPIAVITNVLPDHLNRYSSFKSYSAAKARIFQHQRAGHTVVLNYDNLVTRAFASKAGGKIIWFSGQAKKLPGAYVSNGKAYWQQKKEKPTFLFDLSELRLLGQHNVQNALASAAAAVLLGVPVSKILAAIKRYKGLHDRLEFVRKLRGIKFYNDTTATAPVGVQAALKALSGQPIVLIAGGVDKNLSYSKLAQDIMKHVQSLVLLPGTATVKLQQNLKGFENMFFARNMAQAVKLAYASAPANSIVLLSPGAASFNLFKHEFDRGQQFIRAVKKLT